MGPREITVPHGIESKQAETICCHDILSVLQGSSDPRASPRMHYVPTLPTEWNRLLLLDSLQKSVYDKNLGVVSSKYAPYIVGLC